MSSASAALWQAARDELSDKKRAALDRLQGGSTTSSSDVDQLQKDLKAQIQRSKGAPIKLPNGELFFVRDVFRTVAYWVKKFVEVGDIAVGFDPQHAALPWAAIRFLLQAATNNQDKHAAVLEGIERISFYLAWSRVEEVYLSSAFSSHTELRAAFVKLYASILSFVARASRFLDGKVGRLVGAFTSSDDKLRRNLDEMADHQREISTHTRQLEGAVLRRIPDSLLQLRDELRGLQGPLARIEPHVQDIRDALDRSETRLILDWASTVPFQTHYSVVNEKAMQGTGSWLLNDPVFEGWRTSRRSQMLWLSGSAGTGKSTLVSIFLNTLIEQSASKQAPYPVFFFCSRNPAEPDRASPTDILRCLVRQVADLPGGPPLNARLRKRFEQRRVSGELTSAEAKDIITDILQEHTITYLVVDALDECNPNVRDTLIDALKDIVSESQSLVKVFVTSRTSYADIAFAMEGLPTLYIDAARNKKDIDDFVTSEVDKAVQKRRLLRTGTVSAGLRQRITSTLCDGASGM